MSALGNETRCNANDLADFLAFGFRAPMDGEPIHIDLVSAFTLGTLSRGERDPMRMDRDRPLACEKLTRSLARRFPTGALGSVAWESAPIGKAYTALADLFAMRVHVRRVGTKGFDAREASRLRHVALVALKTAGANFARTPDKTAWPKP